MAKRKARRSYRRRAVSYARSSYGMGGLKGLIRPITAGVITGVAQSFVPNDALGGYADSLVPIGVGYFMKDKALQTIGAYQLGIKIANSIGAPQSSAGAGVY